MVRISVVSLAFAACLPSAFAHPSTKERNSLFGCGTEPTDEFLKLSAGLAKAEKSASKSKGAGLNAAAARNITIPTWFHVVAKSKSLSGGYLPPSAITDQLAVLNNNYAPYGIQFTNAGQDWTINTSWATDGDETAMKQKLRKGDYKTLNIYFQFSLGDNLGYCYFPTTPTASTILKDGCAILYTTAPGGSLANYNQGKTVTHEVGHWFGLLHTFQGGCSGSGDMIADTPPQASMTQGCPTNPPRDSCPGDGVDPIHNYMDYSYDSCYEEFTPDQVTRMFTMYDTYRA